MKKLCLFIAGLFLAIGLYAQQINPKIGYKDGITWGMKRNDVNKKLPTGNAKLKKLNKDKNLQSYKGFADSVEIYESTPSSTDETIVYYYFLDDKLFLVEENLKKEASTTQKLKSRYIGLSETELDGQKTLWDRSVASDGYITQSISVTFLTGKNAGCACVRMYDRETYKKASTIEIPDYEKVVVQTIVGELGQLAQKLVQSSTKKSTYAFIALTSDNGNVLVENYVTDALTEAMFDTGKIKIVERASIEKIMSEQQFQSTALVNENTAVEIGNLSGANFVCYGTVKDLGEQLTLNVKVVEVSTAELCSMGRETVNKDKYLQNVGFEQRKSNAVVASKSGANADGGSTAETSSTENMKTEEIATPITKKIDNNLWKAEKEVNKLDGSGKYAFILEGPHGMSYYLIIYYDKATDPMQSTVRVGIYWGTAHFWDYNYQWSDKSKIDIKDTQGKNYSGNFNYQDRSVVVNGTTYTYGRQNSGRKFFDLVSQNDFLTIKILDYPLRFKTVGLLEKMAEYGITKEEIYFAIANEEF